MGGSLEKLAEQYAAGRASHEEFVRTGDLRSLDFAVATLSDVVRRWREQGCESSTVYASLGWALMSRVGAFGDDVEAALGCFERALQLAPDPTSERVHAVFGLAGLLTIRNAPGDLERSIKLYESVLSVPVPGSYEAETLAIGLSNTLIEWHRRTRDARALDRAVRLLETLAERASAKSNSFAKHSLAKAYAYRYDELDGLTDLMRAVRLLEEQLPLLAASTPERLETGEWLMVSYNNVDRVLDDSSYLERAIEIGEQLLPEAPEGPTRRLLKQRLGMVLINRYAGEDAGRLAQAAELLEDSLIDSANPVALGMLASAHLSRYWLTDSIADIENAYTATVRMLGALRTSFGRLAPLEQLVNDRESWSLYNLAAKCALLLATADPKAASSLRRDAMVAAELGKSRLLTEQVGRTDLPAPVSVPAATIARERALVGQLVANDTAEFAALNGAPKITQTSPEEAARIRRELNALWSEVEQLGAEARDWVELRRGDPLTWQDLQGLAAPGSALVSLAEVNMGLVAFVLRHGADEPVVVQTELREQALTDTVLRLRREVASSDRSRRETWHRPLVPLLEQVARHLDGVQQVVLVPQALTYLIPWVVVAHRAGWRAPDGGPMPLVTVPTLGILPPLRRRAPGTVRRMVVVGDPLGDLPFARSEACAVASQLGVGSLIGSQATSEAVLSELGRADVVHLATHAHFDQRSPLDSGLVLADRVLLTREVLASPMRAELVVLSACETGLTDSLGGNELAGLGQAVLYAGARAVVMSLWRVDDAATSVLLGTFYTQLTAGADAATALSRGAAEVRARWPHPAFWGAFVFLGDAPADLFRELGCA